MGETTDLGDAFLDVLDTGITEKIKTESNLSESQIGAKAEVKPLYTVSRRYCDCCPTWTDKKPKDDDDDVEIRQRLEKARGQYAILKRLTRHGHGQWNTHSIVINSKHIRERLFGVFQGYSNVDLHAAELVFQPPFLPFVHRWEQLMEVQNTDMDESARGHMNLLVDLLGADTEDSFKMLQHIHRTGFVTFEHLELLYVCGEVVLQTIHPGAWSAGILRDVEKICEDGMRGYGFTVDVVDWNGETFGIRQAHWIMPLYKGSRSLVDLEVMPLRVHPDMELVRKLLIDRGRRFENLKGQHLQQYGGVVTVSDGITSLPSLVPEGKRAIPAFERVIVDARTFYALQGRSPPTLRPLQDLEKTLRQEHGHHLYRKFSQAEPLTSISGSGGQSYATKVYSKEKLTAVISGLTAAHFQHPGNREESSDSRKSERLSDEACFLSVAFVKGFNIEAKTWGQFQVSKLVDIEWNDKALSNLVLGDAEKKVITALLSSKQSEGQHTFDDFIHGKGKGLIFLLGGPPGVGKTLTAESGRFFPKSYKLTSTSAHLLIVPVAEHLHRPLYRLGASDLGSTTATVEARLSEALIRCAAWNALLLIDEADVFLQTRSSDNLERNELVSIFLRLLEYYSGILFLTTNRIGTLDPAFESRIDIAFHYPDLDMAGRAAVFRNMLALLPAGSVESLSDADVVELMSEPLNGRHIKSAVKTAYILANSEGCKMSKEHLRQVLEIRKKTKAFLSNSNQDKPRQLSQGGKRKHKKCEVQ